MSKAWYALHPSGDFISRGAWYDSIMAGSIPVVFQSKYTDYLPYVDVVDYSLIQETLPEVWFSHLSLLISMTMIANGYHN